MATIKKVELVRYAGGLIGSIMNTGEFLMKRGDE